MCSIAPGWADDAPKEGVGFYGQINRGFLWYDDGAQQELFAFVDNSKSVSRLGVTWDGPAGDEWQFQARGEIGLNWKETNHISQLDPNDDDYDFREQGIRKLEFSFAHSEYGKFYFGQGAMASDGVTGQDLSLTTVVAGTAVKDQAGGLLLRRADTGELARTRILDRFPTLGSSRRFRLRYDRSVSPDVSFAVAAGREILIERDRRYYVDAAVRYDTRKGDYRVRAAGAIQWTGGYSDTKFREEDVTMALSGSVLHRPSRYNVSGTVGVRAESGFYAYGKLGRRYYHLLPVGWTAFSIDHYYAHDVVRPGDRSNSTGVAAVQQFREYNTQAYLAVRSYDVSDREVDFLRSYAVLTGLRWQF